MFTSDSLDLFVIGLMLFTVAFLYMITFIMLRRMLIEAVEQTVRNTLLQTLPPPHPVGVEHPYAEDQKLLAPAHTQ